MGMTYPFERDFLDRVYGQEIDAYIETKHNEGFSSSTCSGYRKALYIALQILSVDHERVDPSAVTLDDINRVKNFLTDKFPQGVTRSIRVLVDFVSTITGNEPLMKIIKQKRRPIFDLADYGEFRFGKELEKYRMVMVSRGTKPEVVDCRVERAQICCCIIDTKYHPETLADIDVEMMKYLESQLSQKYTDLNTLKSMRIISDFVACITNKNLMREIKGLPTFRINLVPKTAEDEAFINDLQKFIDFMIEWDYSPKTIHGRISALTVVYKYATKLKGPFTLKDFQPIDYKHLRIEMSDAYTDNTIRTNLYEWDRFMYIMTGRKLLKETRLRYNKDSIKRQFIFEDDFIKAFECADIEGKLILALGATLGIRITEMTKIKMDDVMDDMIRINGKGECSGKFAELKIPDLLHAVLEHYLPWRREMLEKFGDRSEGNLLISRSRRNAGAPITKRGIENIIDGIRERSGVSFTSHCLRRYYCMTMKDSGLEIDTIRRMMRHSFIETTMECYIHADPRKTARATDSINTAFSGIKV